ncbi:MAG: extracellular solute-binding protein [Thermomicrobiales bacterium]|nr:extracellular solute-binding protein [Thermomicrobiales bacterium]
MPRGYRSSLTDTLGRRLSRRRALQAGLGAGAALAMTGMAGLHFPAAAQDSAAADVTGDFDWKRYDGATIKVLLNEHPYSDALKANLQTFQDLTGITVQQDTFPETNYFDKLTVDLQSGQATYDAFMLGAYMVWQYGPPGWLEDMSPWIQNASATNPEYDWEDVLPNLRTSDNWSLVVGEPLGSGGQYALPWGFEANTVSYNAEVFDKLGVKPAETMDELVELAAKLTKDAPGAGYEGMYGIATRGARQWATIHPGFMTQYSREGAKDFELQNDVLVPVMNSDIAVDFTDKWAKMMKQSGPANWTNYYWYEVGTDLGAGKAAMIYDADILAYFQNQPGGSASAGKIAWHTGPKGPDGSLLTNQWIWSLGMNAKSQNKPATWTFLQWATGKDHLRYAALEGNMVDPVRRSIVDDPEFIDKMKGNQNFLETFNAIIDDTKILFTPQPQFFDATTLWAGALQEIYGGADAKQTLDALVEEIQQATE